MASIGRLCPSCGELVYGPCPRCEQAGRLRARPRNVPHRVRRRIYDSPKWRKKTRPAVLARDGGLCQRCGAPGTHVDHIVPLLVLLAQGRDPFSPDECQLLCGGCSGEKDGGRRWPDAREEPRAPASSRAPRLV